MLEEVLEQPGAIARTVAALRTLSPELNRLGADRRRVLFAGRGSSDNAATYGRYLLEAVARRPSGSLAPSIATAYRRSLDLRDALVVVISQSGETTELVETLSWARACGAATVAVTNAPDSALARASDLALVTRAGPEIAVPATKTFTTQMAALAVLTESLAPGSLPELDRVPDEVAAVLESGAAVSEAVSALVARSRTVTASRGLTQAVAAEVALKIQETCLRPVLGLSYADLRHGPIAVVDDCTTAVVVAPPDGPLRRGILGLVPDLRSRGALVVGIGAGNDVDVAVPGPRLCEPLAPIGLVAAGQLLVEGMARGLGFDPDRPRGLTKVTETDPKGAA
jgi:glucosamine--fructose-6-phosphate aminotransferase (isomerizing)